MQPSTRRVLRQVAAIGDLGGIGVGIWLLASGESAMAQWGIAVIVMFVATLGALLLSSATADAAATRRQNLAAAGVCLPIPILFFVGALDEGRVTALEWLSIAGALAVAIVNWMAMHRGE